MTPLEAFLFWVVLLGITVDGTGDSVELPWHTDAPYGLRGGTVLWEKDKAGRWREMRGSGGRRSYWPTSATVAEVTAKSDSSGVRSVGRGLLGPTRNCFVQANYAYLCAGSAIAILDPSNPSSPSLLGHCYLADRPVDLHVLDTLAVVVAGDSGLRVIDTSDPTAPTEIGSCHTPGSACGIYVSDTLALVAAGDSGLRVIDISDPTAPAEIGSCQTPGSACGIYVSDTLAFVVDGSLRIIDISSPTAPQLLGSFTPQGGGTRDVWASDTLAYIVNYWNPQVNFMVLDVSDPTAPDSVGSGLFASFPCGIYVVDSLAFVALAEIFWPGIHPAGLGVVDVSNPAAPSLIGLYDSGEDFRRVQVVDTTAYVADAGTALRILNISDPTVPREVGYEMVAGIPWNVSVVDTFVYLAVICWPDFGALVVVNVSDPANPFEAGSYTYNARPISDVEAVDSLAYVAGLGFWIMDVSDPAAIEMLSAYDTLSGAFDDVAVVDTLAYLVGNDLRILDVSDPTDPVEVCSDPSLGGRCISVVDTLAYLGSPGLMIVNVSDATAPYEVGYLAMPRPVEHVSVVDTLVFVADGSAGLRVVNVFDPANPYETGYYDTKGSANGVDTRNGLVYVADGDDGLYILEYDPAIGVHEIARIPRPEFPVAKLFQNAPNPFRNSTYISYQVTAKDSPTLKIYDVAGRLIQRLSAGEARPGRYTVQWDGRDERGRAVSSGCYFLCLETEGLVNTKKMVTTK